MYVKIITSSGFKSTSLTDFGQGQLRVRFRFGPLWPMLEFSGSCTYLPEVVVSSAGSSTTRAARHKMGKKIGAEFMTSVSYRPEVMTFHTRYVELERLFRQKQQHHTGDHITGR